MAKKSAFSRSNLSGSRALESLFMLISTGTKIKQLEKWVQGNLQPDMTLLFDVPIEISMKRISSAREPDKFERENADFFAKLRQAYLTRAKENPVRFRVIDANQALDKVKSLVEEVISML